MGDMGEDFSALREFNRQRRESNRQQRTPKIRDLEQQGWQVRELTSYQFRLGCLIDIYPTHAKFHDLVTGERGRYNPKNLLGFLNKRYSREEQV